MDRADSFNRLKFNNDLFLNQQINPIAFIQLHTLINNGKWYLPPTTESHFAQSKCRHAS